MDRVSIDRIAEAHELIDPVFKDSPQYVSEPLSHRFGMRVVLKVESVNPIRSFKGRGTDYLFHRLGPNDRGYVCASAGNFGQGMAYAARKRGIAVTVFASVNANPLKVDRMRALGATVVLEGQDFDAAKTAARRQAEATGAMFVEDGALAPIAEGAGTIALELTVMREPIDVVLVPLGDGALITGIGAWLRERSPASRVIGVVADRAPAMDLSWRAKEVVAADSSTIADGIAVRRPSEVALGAMEGNVDDIVRVSEEEIVAAMRLLMNDAGLIVEPAGAAGLAAVRHVARDHAGSRVAVIVTGGNLTEDQIRAWLLPQERSTSAR
jgi:threonine dehydratase